MCSQIRGAVCWMPLRDCFAIGDVGYARRSTVVPWARPIPYAGGLHARAPQPIPFRPFRRRVVAARAVARVCRKTWSPTEVAGPARCRRRLLLAQKRLRLADAA